jgi:hypothetical protein
MPMKKLLTILVLLFAFSMVHADNSTNLVIKQKAGNETILSLDSKPIITFEGEYMIVKNDFATISFPIADVDQYSVSTSTDVKEIHSQPRLLNGQVTINDLPKGSKAYIHSIDGKVIREFDANGLGTVTFNLRDLPKGTYIISAPNTRFKMSNK